MLLVALIAAGSFAVIAQRRLRQLGMLAAVGAGERQVRFVVVANGLIVGLVSALAGAVLGIVVWFLAMPMVEEAVGRRMEVSNLPVWLVLVSMVLAVIASTGAAWWPARSMSRLPAVLALSGRPPRPVPAHRSAALGIVLTVAGMALLTRVDPEKNGQQALLTLVGVLGAAIGVLMLSPFAIRILGAVARRFPVAVRLAFRDLARHQARSGFALAAITLALAIPLGVVVTAAAAAPSADEGNLASNEVLIRLQSPRIEEGPPCPGGMQGHVGEESIFSSFTGPCEFVPVKSAAELTALLDVVNRIAALGGGGQVQTLDVAYDPDTTAEDGSQPVIGATRQTNGGFASESLLFVATPELLAYYGVDPAGLDPGTRFLSVVGNLAVLNIDRNREGSGPVMFEPELVENLQPLKQGYTDHPGTFITAEELAARGWKSMTSGWLVALDKPLTDDEFTQARELAAEAGLVIEQRDERTGLATLRTTATGAGLLVALSVLAMTIGLLRGEAAGQLRTLTATGATSRVRRTLTAATTGSMALLGVVLATIGVYLALAAMRNDDLASLGKIPYGNLTVMLFGVPVLATIAGWLFAGREPSAIARQAME
jgi:putative ABC transport system permease protein